MVDVGAPVHAETAHSLPEQDTLVRASATLNLSVPLASAGDDCSFSQDQPHVR